MGKKNKEPTNAHLRVDIKARGQYALDKNLVPGGISTFGGLLELALEQWCDRNDIPKDVEVSA